MPNRILHGIFCGIQKTYRSKNGQHYFEFDFINQGNYFDIYCTTHPSFNGKDSDPHKTHLFHSGKICFVAGKAPKSQFQAEKLASQWAEYFLNYRNTGQVQS